jgi:hypothetical protein
MPFEREGVVSLWVFMKDEDPDDFEKDVLKSFCGVESYEIDSQEGVVSKDLQPISQLLEQLSYSESFASAASAAAHSLGIAEAYGVIAQFDFAYDPKAVTKPIAVEPVFIGSFPWRE